MQLKGFQVFKFRNIIDSGWVDVSSVSTFVGQNECGKSNLLQALFMLNPYDEEEQYRINSDWPIDMWPPGDPSEVVCKAVARKITAVQIPKLSIIRLSKQ